MELTLNMSLTSIHDKKPHILYRLEVPQSNQITVHSAGVVDKDGNTHSDVEIQIYDDDNDTTEYSTSDEYEEPSSVYNLGGNEVLVQVENENGTTMELAGFMEIELS